MTSPPQAAEARVTRLAVAMQHPVRVRILAHLRSHDTASPSELASAWNLRLGVLAYHCRKLETLGLVAVVRRVQRRGAVEHRYALTAEAPGAELLTVGPRR